jgi:4-hydroxybenzoate polyprenyl transferase
MKKQQNKLNIFDKLNIFLDRLFQNLSSSLNGYYVYIGKSPYTRLIRLHQPIGIKLLILPILWVVTIAAENFTTWLIYALFFTIGAVVTRSAGVIINDIIDHKIDKEVSRTKSRPLASGELTIKQALLPLLLLLCGAATMLMLLPIKAQILCVVAFVMLVIYPLMKRWTAFAQVFLGFVFNMGVLIAWYSLKNDMSVAASLIYCASIFWTVAYDTIYAFQDHKEDEAIGMQSLATLLADRFDKIVLLLYQIIFVTLCIAALNAFTSYLFFIVMLLTYKYIENDLKTLDLQNKKSCATKFQNNFNYGLMILFAFMLGRI